MIIKKTVFAFVFSLVTLLMSASVQADTYKAATPDSRLVRSLMDTPIPSNLDEIAHIPETLQRLLLHTESNLLNAYIERSFLLGMAGQPLPRVETVGAAIEQERQQSMSLNEVRHDTLANLLSVRIANSGDTLPQGVLNRPESYQSIGDGVWQPVPINEKAIMYYLHVVTLNQGKAALRAFRAELRVRARPGDEPVVLECGRYAENEPALAVGASLSMFCATDWRKKQRLKQLLYAARSIMAGEGALDVEIQAVTFWDNKLQLQRGLPGHKTFHARYLRSYSVSAFPESKRSATEIVEDSACWDRGTCLREAAILVGIDGGPNIGNTIAFVMGLICYASLTRARQGTANVKALFIASAVGSLLPILLFIGVVNTKGGGLGLILIPILGARYWIAFLIALWGSWIIHRIRVALVTRWSP